MLERLDMMKNMPKFSFSHIKSNGCRMHLCFNIENISENVATEIVIYNIRVVDKDEEEFWSDSLKHTCHVLADGKPFPLALKNPPLEKDGMIFRFGMNCKDKYEESHTYDVVGKCETKNSFPNFKVTEITQ